MKTFLKNTIFVVSLIVAFIACDDNMGKPDTRLSQVESLVEPANDKAIVLQPSATASVYFEWDYAGEAAGGTSIYQLAFDKVDGDFSNPVYVVFADNNGYYNHASVTHKVMNKIAGMMGIATSETGTFKWCVFSTKGEKTMKAAQENKITITRLSGFADLPVDVYVTGQASEGGNDLSRAPKMKAISGGEFEIYTKLKAGQPFYFTDDILGTPRQFSTADGLIKESGTSTVTTDGVYRINLDFNTGACSYSLVTRIAFYFSPSGEALFDLPYAGYGVFKAAKQTVTFKQEGWGRDQRYKFRMFVKENAGANPEKELEWGTLNQTDSPPNASSPESYYYMQLLTNLSQWDNKWKLMSDFDGVPADYAIYLTADRPYTHSITK